MLPDSEREHQHPKRHGNSHTKFRPASTKTPQSTTPGGLLKLEITAPTRNSHFKRELHDQKTRQKTRSTPCDSQVVPHPSTKQAHWGLASQFGTGCGALPKVWSNTLTWHASALPMLIAPCWQPLFRTSCRWFKLDPYVARECMYHVPVLSTCISWYGLHRGCWELPSCLARRLYTLN